MKKYTYWHEIYEDIDIFEKYTEYRYKKHIDDKKEYFRYVGNIGLDSEIKHSLNFDNIHFFEGYFRQDIVDGFFDDNIMDVSKIDRNVPCFFQIINYLNLTEDTQIRFNAQPPSQMIGNHTDGYKSFFDSVLGADITPDSYKNVRWERKYEIDEIKRYIIFLDDWTEGQVFMTGKDAIVDWKAGDVFSFEWYIPHSTANASTKTRNLLVVTGIENN